VSEAIRKPSSVLNDAAVDTDSAPDRRAAPRRRVLKGATATFQDRHCSIPCMVRDISTSGARIKSTHCANIPDSFELIIDLDGMEVKCEVVWRRANEMGVRFVDRPAKVPPKRSQVVHAVAVGAKPTLRRLK